MLQSYHKCEKYYALSFLIVNRFAILQTRETKTKKGINFILMLAALCLGFAKGCQICCCYLISDADGSAGYGLRGNRTGVVGVVRCVSPALPPFCVIYCSLSELSAWYWPYTRSGYPCRRRGKGGNPQSGTSHT